MSGTEPCRYWTTSPPIPHGGHCCFADDPTPLADIIPGTPPPCGHFVLTEMTREAAEDDAYRAINGFTNTRGCQ